MEAREALDRTITHFRLHAGKLAERAGVGENELSRYRRGHSDVLSEKAFKIVRALPASAQLYFWSLCTADSEQGERLQKEAIAA